MNLHKEVNFEREICEHLGAKGWLYAEGDAAQHDRASGLFLPDLLAWIETTQPESWERLQKTHGPQLTKHLSDRVRKNLDEVVSGFTTNLIRKYASLTPREVQIANMIQQDMTIKEMAEALHISESSVASRSVLAKLSPASRRRFSRSLGFSFLKNILSPANQMRVKLAASLKISNVQNVQDAYRDRLFSHGIKRDSETFHRPPASL